MDFVKLANFLLHPHERRRYFYESPFSFLTAHEMNGRNVSGRYQIENHKSFISIYDDIPSMRLCFAAIHSTDPRGLLSPNNEHAQ